MGAGAGSWRVTGAEPSIGSAAWSTATVALVFGTLTPQAAAMVIVVFAGVVLGVMTRRTLAATRARPMPTWRTEVGLSFIEVLIAVLIIQKTGYSPLGALGIGVGVAAAGAALIERLLARFEAWIDRVFPELPAHIPVHPPSTTMFTSPGSGATIPKETNIDVMTVPVGYVTPQSAGEFGQQYVKSLGDGPLPVSKGEFFRILGRIVEPDDE
jgi:hypothetical protein